MIDENVENREKWGCRTMVTTPNSWEEEEGEEEEEYHKMYLVL